MPPGEVEGMRKRLSRMLVPGMLAFGLMAAAVVARAVAPGTSGSMADAANRLVASWSPEQKAKGVFTLAEAHRSEWYYVPKPDRHGVPLKSMDGKQRDLVQALLRTTLSSAGSTKVTQIMELENQLAAVEKDPIRRDPELYFLSIYGKPSTKEPWAWRFEGHHVSLHFTVISGGVIASVPQFLGANPAEVREGPLKGRRVLGHEEDMGRQLLQSLDDKQKARAVFAKEAFKEIVTTNQPRVDALKPEGIPAGELNPAQVEALKQLINEHASAMVPVLAAERIARVKKAGYDKLWFGWAGGANLGEPHYYRIGGPTFLIEYDNTQNKANHVHAVWRDFEGDFGRDLLREHYKAAH